jgi:hypothetical protein
VGVLKGIRNLTRRGETSRRPVERYTPSDPSVRAGIAAATQGSQAPSGATASRSTLLSRRGAGVNGTHRLKAGSARKYRF